ncbi:MULTISPECIES: hypothetical protein [Paenibacillus]|uniref:hypothetical protein n=1 Tax=Paenibacillus TaxID=44249 RepID=UPI0009A6A272|nr:MULTISPECIES: hypothetical protein [Paenibacillus]WDQ34421.1 hypothetical protein PTQ21_09335 [Paenibacillus marchantiae]SLK19067.1 hypothetical protein SAMN06272722_113106 [Paenibacillus sp. RU5A]SOC75589.1 hypothetical protein SAMN05880581_113106 [Paenibacillus sp. RU26A]SOC77546.1 hypothetical protein SAMN05880586_113106 [Paenibacillus sp. RU5M]
MIESLESLAEPLIRTRLELLYNNLSHTQPDYTQLSEESDHYFHTIRQALPEYLNQTIFLYEDTQLSMQTLLEREIYLQGFRDALQLMSELHIQRF